MEKSKENQRTTGIEILIITGLSTAECGPTMTTDGH